MQRRRGSEQRPEARDVAQQLTCFHKHELDVLFVLLPSPYQVHENVFDTYVTMFDIDRTAVDIDQLSTLLARAFGIDSLKLLDPLEYLRARAQDGTPLYGSIDNHLNAEGHRAVAEFLKPYVEPLVEAALRKDDEAPSP